MEERNFENLDIKPQLKRALDDMGFVTATPIQAKTLEAILSGKDVIGQAQTGSGKTAAFAIPCIEKTNAQDDSLQSVILAPTRELAIQICEEFRKILKYTDDIKVLPVYGGQPIVKQISALRRGVQIVVGTPGRVIDHIKRHTLKMQNVKYVVLDEADEMLNMGFREDIEKILVKIPQEHQTLLFSATMPKPIVDITHKYQKDPLHIKADSGSKVSVPKIDQKYIELKEKTKDEAVCRLLEYHMPELAIVFCNMKKRVDSVVEMLLAKGYAADGLHGDMDQLQRDSVMKKFRSGTINILVATDIAARGIDVDNVELVINHDLPLEAEYYVHRIGRTGRAGKSGIAYSLVTGKEKERLKSITALTGQKIKVVPLPSFTDITDAKTKSLIGEVKEVIKDGRLDKYITAAEKLEKEGWDMKELAAALLKLNLYDPDIDEYEDDINKGEKIRTLYIDAGKKDGIRVKDIIGALAGESGIQGSVIGDVELHDTYTLVEIPKKYIKDVLKGMKGKKIKKKTVKVSVSK